jgi:toxin-antitoxin system PIN domain toxin
MIAVDTNVLIFAHKRQSPFHVEAKRALEGLASARTTWAIPWPCVYEFFSVVTNPRIYEPASTADQAVAQLDAWLQSPSVALLSEHRDHWTDLRPLLISRKLAGGVVHDAKIAAICISHGVRELLTMDRDFSRFPALNTRSLIA